MTDHFKEPLPPGVKNLDDFEIHFPNGIETILPEAIGSPEFSISVTYEESNAFKNYVNSVRDFHGNEAFGEDPLIESLIDKICHPEVSK